MKKSKVVAVVLVVIAVASFAVGGFASAQTESPRQIQYASAVWAKVYGAGSFIDLETLGEWQTLLSIALPPIPMNAYYHVVCDGYCYLSSVESELLIAVGVDSTTADGSTYRFFGGLPRDGDILTGIHTERVYHLGAGSHTFYFLGELYGGTLARVNYHTITVTVYTNGGLTELLTGEVDVPSGKVSE